MRFDQLRQKTGHCPAGDLPKSNGFSSKKVSRAQLMPLFPIQPILFAIHLFGKEGPVLETQLLADANERGAGIPGTMAI